MAEQPPGAFEQKVARLEAIVKELENGNVELDRSVALFNEGKTLARECDELLKGAQAQIDRAMESTAPTIPPPEPAEDFDIPF